jgi:hypothetical protein
MKPFIEFKNQICLVTGAGSPSGNGERNGGGQEHAPLKERRSGRSGKHECLPRVKKSLLYHRAGLRGRRRQLDTGIQRPARFVLLNDEIMKGTPDGFFQT